jgi:hypothetical protein
MMRNIREVLCDMGYEDAVVFETPSYDDAIVGVSDGRVVYDFNKMVDCLVNDEDMAMSEEEAVEFIEYNTIRALSYIENAPIVMFPILE